MTVLTQEQFDAVPVGEFVNIGGTSGTPRTLWERVEEGWRSDGIILSANHFTGEVASNRVVRGAPTEVGQLWITGTMSDYLYLIVSEDHETPGTWWALRMAQENYENPTLETYKFRRMTTLTAQPGRLCPRDEHPSWYPSVFSIGTSLFNKQMDYKASQAETLRVMTREREVTRERDETRNELASLRTNVAETLRNALMAEESITREALREALAAHDIVVPGPQVEVPVTVTIAGSGIVTVEPDVLSKAVSDAVTVTAGAQARVYFNMEETVKHVVEEGTCACSNVNRGVVTRMLQDKSVVCDSFTYTTACPNHDQGLPSFD